MTDSRPKQTPDPDRHKGLSYVSNPRDRSYINSADAVCFRCGSGQLRGLLIYRNSGTVDAVMLCPHCSERTLLGPVSVTYTRPLFVVFADEGME